ncbi:MAG TPA: hypothetical protein VFE47_29605 [Tepidisphaeraceae bacterium]|nr:hypothetical protein [Tepidisphaeraceae bacterium]
MRFPQFIFLAAMMLATSANADAPKPATLLGGRIEFMPPADWSVVKSPQSSNTVAIYMADDHDGYLAIAVLPDNAATTPQAARRILVQLRINHKKAGQEVVEEATVEKDPRFAMRIHERYKTKDGKVADETHLYRQVAGRVLELDVQSVSDDQPKIDATQKAGEDMLLSAVWKTPAQKEK